jgi:drug/metabolite transporter (DMT)-like permease
VLIANLVPLVMPIALWVMVSEKPKSREVFATIIAMSGVAIMVSSDLFRSGSLREALTAQTSYLRGDLLAFAAMCMLAVYLVLAKRNKAVPSIWLYIVPVYAVAGVMCLPLAVILHGTPPSLDLKQTGLFLALVILPTVMGHTLLNIAMWWFRGQVVSIFNLFQFTFTGVMAYLILNGEMPTRALYLAATTIVTAVVILVWPKKSPAVELTYTEPVLQTQES